jgi:ADP-heptose:LPS heptosyltransferase
MQLHTLPPNASVCVISARRFGDAIINANFLSAAAKKRPDIQWFIWTKPEFTPLFELMGFTNIVTSQFPIAGGTSKVARECGFSLIKAIYQLRKMHIDASIDFIGDSREAFLGWLISGQKHHSPRWSTTHWMHKLIWNFKIPFVNYIKVDSNQDRVYQIIPSLLSKLTGKEIRLESSITPISNAPSVAFHVFPSARFREWPMENWLLLADMLNTIGIQPTLICTQAEQGHAEKLFKSNTSLSIRACPSIKDLIIEIQKIDLLVGVDSFLIHLASALDKRTISLVAGNLPHWWSPDEAVVIAQSGGCAAYPCAHQPICLGKQTESQCIKSVEPTQVMTSIHAALSSAL